MREGLKAVSPGLIALGIWGVVTGVAMVKAGLTEFQAIVMSLLVYAGSAQLTALPLMAAASVAVGPPLVRSDKGGRRVRPIIRGPEFLEDFR